MTRQLIMIDWEDNRPVSSLPLYYPPCISPRMNLVDVLQLLQKGGSHIAFVCAGRSSFRRCQFLRTVTIHYGS
jgi:CBS domain containing-hemolysin-like protein